MSVTAKTLIAAKSAEATDTTQYTATGVRTIIDKFTATNTDTVARTLQINLVPLSGAVAVGNRIVQAKSLASGETYTFPEIVGHILEAGSFISTIASAASVITIRSSGREIT